MDYGVIFITRSRFEDNEGISNGYDFGVNVVAFQCVREVKLDSSCSTSEFEKRVMCIPGYVPLLQENCTEDYVCSYYYYYNCFIFLVYFVYFNMVGMVLSIERSTGM
jgi:hypothetical protein